MYHYDNGKSGECQTVFFLQNLRGFTGFVEYILCCVSAEFDRVRQDHGRACRRFRARIPGCVRGPGPDSECAECLPGEPTRP